MVACIYGLKPAKMTDTTPPKEDPPLYITNPRTNRRLKFGSKSYYKYIEEQNMLLEAEQHRLKMEQTRETSQPAPIRKALAKEMVNIVASNKSKFSDLSKKETDKLLRKLLLEKLKSKKKKKKKKVITPPTSSDESSDSDSDSSDSE